MLVVLWWNKKNFCRYRIENVVQVTKMRFMLESNRGGNATSPGSSVTRAPAKIRCTGHQRHSLTCLMVNEWGHVRTGPRQSLPCLLQK